jgi:hypothetical protein
MSQHYGMVTKASHAEFGLSPLGFHVWANEHLDFYQDSVKTACPLPAPHILLCRVIELEFKAWHQQAQKRGSIKDIFGHDLLASYRALPARYRILSPDEARLLMLANKVYSKTDFACVDVGRVGRRRMQNVVLAGLEALAQKVMAQGDRLSLAQVR